MILFNAQVNDVVSLIGEITLLAIVIFGSYCYISLSREENPPSPPHRPTPQGRTSTTTGHKKQSLKNMKRVAVKKDGQYKYYRINKYGELFEEQNGEQQ